ncbi:MOP flippase family protein [Halonatronum saccharophilum]|uniref:MOP flippase family protein n=1 Tax=Halonatronum saccharophilum TaxID=150060 RepID=UPI0004875D7D|nr:MOP flippase family protein [Halonatronum saccharophilum]
MASLKDKAVKGVKWTTIYSVCNVAINPLALAILARLLSPVEFGKMAIVTIVIGFSKQIAQLGFSQAIIQKDEVSDDDLNSIFWFEQVLGIVSFVIIFSLAENISLFFNEPNAIRLIRYSAFVFLLEPIDLVFRSLLKKELKFDLLTKAMLVKLLFQKVSMVTFAYLGFGAVSFVYGNLIGIIILTLILLIIFLKNNLWFPKLYFSFSKLKPYLNFGIFIAAKSVFTNLFDNIDEIIIGGSLGTEILGVYHFAKKLIRYLVQLLNHPVSGVSFPLLSKLKSNSNQFNNVYKKIIKLIGLIGIPANIGVAVTSSLFIPLLFGEEWNKAILVITLLTLWGSFELLTHNIAPRAIYALGYSKIVFYITVVDLPIRGLILYLGAQFNLEMVAISLGIFVFVKFLIFQVVLGKFTDLKLVNVISELKYIAISSLIMGIIIWLLKIWLIQITNIFLVLIIIILIAVICYIILIYLFEREFFVYTLKLISKSIN